MAQMAIVSGFSVFIFMLPYFPLTGFTAGYDLRASMLKTLGLLLRMRRGLRCVLPILGL